MIDLAQAVPPAQVIEMLQLYANFLIAFSRDLTLYESQTAALSEMRDKPVTQADRDILAQMLERCDALTSFMFMPATKARRERLTTSVNADCFYPELGIQLRVLREAMEDEVKDLLILHMPPGQAIHFFAAENLLGAEVVAKFPALAPDIDEAGKCLGAGRYTATIFHLMRVLEVGVQQFGDKLNVKLLDDKGDEKGWNQLLEQSDKAIRAMDKSDPMKPKLAAVSALLGSVRIAWRNEVMHPKASYDLTEATRVLDATKAFMSELVSVL